jgi:hypothetical protein
MRVFAALRDDISQGWVWLDRNDLPLRSIVRVNNQANGKVVYCEALQIDKNFLRVYNQAPRLSITDTKNTLVVGAWYRLKLGVATQVDYDFDVRPSQRWWGRFWACAHHPQIVVRIAIWLAAWSVVLGLLGAVLGVISICR